ncbi:hypothetical protein EUGRSUZ_G01055 [Eucalyptus grandis]|uniref:Uncharacterized protein n=2 Tax=Eucalyptus grandis TaxID=71139 RepID=A0ACC3K2F5_EUCGR|nr:hypothetical protein EUGRSUZ_G01055 [Eucalyptus grandis]
MAHLTIISLLLPRLANITNLATAATLLPQEEVDALKEIAKMLGKSDWDFDADPCGKEGGWGDDKYTDTAPNAVISRIKPSCRCENRRLREQSLAGTLPPRLFRLPFLQTFCVLENRLTGPIPKELGNISTLQHLWLTSNNFTGELPQTFVNFTKLTHLRLGDNQFTGKIPDFIQNLTNLQVVVIQGSGLQGPIPSGIALLEQLNDLRISDLNGPESRVPQLNSTVIATLILRSCNLMGELPGYLANMTNLKTLDLSFNKLSGEIPRSYSSLEKVDYMYLTGNQLTGAVPDWILAKGKNVDLSYNNFTAGGSECRDGSVNLFASSEVENATSCSATSGLVSCLQSQRCAKARYNLFINCGGSKAKVRGTTYEDDSQGATPSSFFRSDYWAYSSTGYFTTEDGNAVGYEVKNTSTLSMNNAQLYIKARRSAVSLTYYGFCLMDGPYNVTLHFAEIMITGNKSYRSLGRRAFNIYIQGKLVWKDFNIEIEAGGAGKEGTLEIRFYWAGKGTNTGMFDRGVYGPLISAISVYPGFDPPASISAGTVAGILAAIVFVVFLILVILWWRGCLGRKDKMARDLKGLALQIGLFTLRQIKAATNNFDTANKIGEGGFGSVYKGFLSDGTTIAVKQLSSKSQQGNNEFLTELGMISALQHPHLVKLYGCCIEGNQLLLVYEYMENNSLARALFGPEEFQLKLDWWTRHKICVGIARGLAYLHEESKLKIVHRDIKAPNVLLDKDLNPKISDFGLAKLDEEDKTHISTKIAGTYGYMAPEYAMHGYLTDKADIYSFGIVALEVVNGQSNTSSQRTEEYFNLLDWAHFLKEGENLIELVDPRLGSHFNKAEALALIKVALMCTNVTPALRPPMSSVVSMLEGKVAVPVLDSAGAIMTQEKIEAMRKHFGGDEHQAVGENISKSMSIEGP